MDHRDSAHLEKWWDSIDEKSSTVTATVFTGEDGDEEEKQIKFQYQVCPICDGKGSHVNPSIDAHGLSSEDFAEDPDFANDYMSGRFDQPCNLCHGNRVTPWPVEEDDVKAVQDLINGRFEIEREYEAERRMGA
jgi:hypothetical protein